MNSKRHFFTMLMAALTLTCASSLSAQQTGGGGGDTGGGGTGGVTGGTTGGVTGGTTGGTTTQQGGTTQANSQGSQGFDTGLDLGLGEVVFEDKRNQGFVGPTSAALQERGFVGAGSTALGSTPIEGSFGGGVNSSGGGGGGGRATTGLQGRAGVLGAGTQQGFQVNRTSLRTPLLNRISYNQPSPTLVASRFQDRSQRIPAVSNVAQQYRLQIADGVAIITGDVPDRESAQRIEALLRLEPGIYRIDNRLSFPQ